MRGLSLAIRRVVAIPVAIIAMISLSASPAAASSNHGLSIRGVAACDAATRWWIVTWSVTNRSDVTGTIGNVRVYPSNRPVVGLPSRIQPGETITGEQRLLASEYTGSIVFDVNWDDGQVVYNYWWPIYIKSSCGA